MLTFTVYAYLHIHWTIFVWYDFNDNIQYRYYWSQSRM